MPADQLLLAVLGDRSEVASASLLEQEREEVDLEEDVAELVEEPAVVAALGGVGQLIGLLDSVGNDRALVLLAVPGAFAPQAAGDLVEPGDGLATSLCGRAVALGQGEAPGGRPGTAPGSPPG